MRLVFEWDEAKAGQNLRKHGISFEEARTVFGDPLAITISAPEHPAGEERYVDIGRSAAGRILVVVYAERVTRIRIISCRRATKSERANYEEIES